MDNLLGETPLAEFRTFLSFLVLLQGLIVVRKSGAVSVCSTSTMDNLLGEAPELLSGPPSVASVRGEKEGLLALDCEVHVNYRHRSVDEPEPAHHEV